MSFWSLSVGSAKPKNLTLTYDAPNEDNTFTAGDSVTGTVSFTLSKDTKVKRVRVKFKGFAHVSWSEGVGDDSTSYSATRSFFNFKDEFVENKPKGTVLPEGEHVFKFKFQIPSEDLPSSFKSSCGEITYMLEAKICRSWKFPLKEQMRLRFLSYQIPLQCPVSGSVRKEKVEMSATVDKKVCCPGDILSVVANICNSSSSKAVRPKFQLIKREIYHAVGSTTSNTLSHGKVVGEYISANSKEAVSCQLRVPVDAVYSIHNCEILTVEYYVKAYVDVSFAIDPEVELPVVVIPARYASQMHDETLGNDFASHFPTGPYPVHAGPGAPFQPGQAVRPYPGEPGHSDFLPQGPYHAPTGQGAYGYQAQAPAQPAPSTSGFHHQWPQRLPPDGDPPAAFHPQVPTAQLQQGQNPPNYESLFPSNT